MFPTQGRHRTPWDGNCHTRNAQSLHEGRRRAPLCHLLECPVTPSSWSRDRYPLSCPSYRAHLGPNLSESKAQPGTKDNISLPPLRDLVPSIHGQVDMVMRFNQGREGRWKLGGQGSGSGQPGTYPGETAAGSTVCEPRIHAQGDASLSRRTSPPGLKTVTQGIKLKAWGCPE